MLLNLQLIYRKLRAAAQIIPGEYQMLFRDYDKRLSALEEQLNETRVEKPKSTGRKSDKVSKSKS